MKRNYGASRIWKRKLDLVVGLGTMALAALVFFLTLSPGVFPGLSAALIATYTGIEPQIAPAHPLWGALVEWIGGLAANSLAYRLNAFSALCGIACTGLLYLLVSTLLYRCIDDDDERAPRAVVASVMGGAVAAVALAFSVPFWMVSTRLHFQGFDLLLLLLLTWLFLAYLAHGRLGLGLLFALLYGVGAVESVIFVAFAPVFVFYSLYGAYRQNKLRFWRFFLLGLAGLAGLAFSLWVARRFFLMEDLSLRGYKDYWDVVRTMLRDHAKTMRVALPEVGWLLIVLLIIVPWLAAQLIARRSLNETREWGIYLFHLVMTIIVCVLLGNAPVSPWSVLRGQGGLPVMMYALTAMVAGYLAAYWILLADSDRTRKPVAGTTPGNASRARMGVWLGFTFSSILVVMVAGTATINGFEASGRRGAFVDACARELLDHLEGRRWLVSDGLLDNHLRIEAARRGQPLTLLALQKNDNPIYIRQVKKLVDQDPAFREADKVRLKNVLDLGIMAFIQDWLAENPELISQIAVMSAPDLLVGAKWTVAPLYFGFVGVANRDDLKTVDYLKAYAPFWERMARLLAKSRGVRDPVADFRGALRRQVGFVANNTGVLLEDLGRPEEAYAVYRRARAVDVENISALLNMAEMLNRDPAFHPEDKPGVEQELKTFVDNMAHRLPVWSLSRFFGYVRSPVLFAQLGWTWALSGQPGMAMAGLARAEAISPTLASRTRVRSDMAEIFIQQGEDERGEAIYEEILKSEPDNQRALVSMARIATRRGTLDKAREWLDRASAAGADRAALTLERAAIDLAANQPEEARIKLAEITELQPKNLQAFGMLAIAMMQMKDFDEVERRVLPKMESVAGTPDNYLVQITRGQLGYQKGRAFYPASRDAFERAAVLRPGLPMLLEWILRLDFLLDDKPAAEKHARQILRINRGHGFANYIMGSLMLGRDKHAEAEDYLRRSVSASKSAAALNDLAELLRKSGNYAEAERQARAAIELSPDLYFAWDTLGGVLADTRRWEDAEKAYARALEIFQDDLRVHLNLAKLLKQMGNTVKAREIVSQIQPRRGELPPADQQELDILVRELTPGARQ